MLINTSAISPSLFVAVFSLRPARYAPRPSTSSYLERMEFLQRKIFVCEHTNKAGLDYFAAHASEVEDLRLVRRRFPDELKAKVLASVQFRKSVLSISPLYFASS